jgi:hypothetical protein
MAGTFHFCRFLSRYHSKNTIWNTSSHHHEHLRFFPERIYICRNYFCFLYIKKSVCQRRFRKGVGPSQKKLLSVLPEQNNNTTQAECIDYWYRIDPGFWGICWNWWYRVRCFNLTCFLMPPRSCRSPAFLKRHYRHSVPCRPVQRHLQCG